MVGHAGETFADLLGVVAVDRAALVPPVLGALEEVSLAIFVRKRGIDVACKVTERGGKVWLEEWKKNWE